MVNCQQIRLMKKLILFLAAIALFTFSCKTDPTNSCGTLDLQIEHQYNGQPFSLNTQYTSGQGNPIWFTGKRYYLSHIDAVRSDGSKIRLSEIEFVNTADGDIHSISKTLPTGNYNGFELALGVDSTMNNQDPTVWPNDHPLSVYNGMYWTWGTMYIFSTIEGFEYDGTDSTAFFIHMGTNPLYRPNLMVNQPFSVPESGTTQTIVVDIHTILNQSGYTFNLIDDGRSHTTSNYELAAQYADNFSAIFN